MESSATKQAREKSASPAVATAPQQRMPPAPATKGHLPLEEKAVGYGLPCSHCHAYYPSDMNACPICKSPDRVTPTKPVMHVTAPTPAAAIAQPTTEARIDEERERFLKELTSQPFASHTQINAAATFPCVLDHQHSGATEPAAVCHTCHSDVRQQADRMEAALYMDTKEAAKIVYEAVWADTSDTSKTYLNAATALLAELRKRAGLGVMLGSQIMRESSSLLPHSLMHLRPVPRCSTATTGGPRTLR